MTIRIPVSAGELVDKITVLELKFQHVSHLDKRRHITDELAQLETIFHAELVQTESLWAYRKELQATNAKIYKLLDALEEFEEAGTVWADDAQDALEDVYFLNKHRFDIKSKINDLCNSQITEVKSYT